MYVTWSTIVESERGLQIHRLFRGGPHFLSERATDYDPVDTPFGLGRVHQAWSDSSPEFVRVFRDKEKAIEWLCELASNSAGRRCTALSGNCRADYVTDIARITRYSRFASAGLP